MAVGWLQRTGHLLLHRDIPSASVSSSHRQLLVYSGGCSSCLQPDKMFKYELGYNELVAQEPHLQNDSGWSGCKCV